MQQVLFLVERFCQSCSSPKEVGDVKVRKENENHKPVFLL